ncbi:MAG: PAS domain-containing protein [Planctomycetota bacterium]
MRRTTPKKFCNLYKFIRLILDNDIADRKIARQWKMDEKNFHDFKYGLYPVPRVHRLVTLAKILKVNEHFVFAVSIGEPAGYVYNVIKNKGLIGKEKITVNQINEILAIMARTTNKYWNLFENPDCSEAIVDVETSKIVDCNKIAGNLTGWSREELIGKNPYLLVPPSSVNYLQKSMGEFIKQGKKVDLRVFDMVGKNGKRKSVLTRTALFDINGHKYLNVMIWDLSQIKHEHKKIPKLGHGIHLTGV